MSEPLWQPSAERIEQANMSAFARMVAGRHGAEPGLREVIHGRPVKNVEAPANPQSLELDRDLPALHS